MKHEKLLELILDKLDNIEKQQQEMKTEQQTMKKELCKRLDSIEKSQKGIQQYVIYADDTFKKFEEDHKFIERLKKAIGE
ncbi:hypothetical protein [Paramaledivibacter caminithermalis]|jgi:hypothetical protein|uniref:Uncharacterized protein n=1 Tax=Paramaledivibacter caminithermalis (strain DSM 15212 / CIP 107654 / DViRD3) TaxID=1121301 RepID=A0A1M6KF01_PARC5|nr:hypothetical protein [Paramaledivibacter caminithermalis]SHJ57480.1 hypothetical protein SAMN02745912_00364 [Paramaledivibacter caminithermalis DSM 15212]